ncbi:MAG: hypothetical protein COA44_15780 [Arcobacter sp.]|nr:MAG: hypothetical protein COA44_15780 [Arcobacter sp.]
MYIDTENTQKLNHTSTKATMDDVTSYKDGIDILMGMLPSSITSGHIEMDTSMLEREQTMYKIGLEVDSKTIMLFGTLEDTPEQREMNIHLAKAIIEDKTLFDMIKKHYLFSHMEEIELVEIRADKRLPTFKERSCLILSVPGETKQVTDENGKPKVIAQIVAFDNPTVNAALCGAICVDTELCELITNIYSF